MLSKQFLDDYQKAKDYAKIVKITLYGSSDREYVYSYTFSHDYVYIEWTNDEGDTDSEQFPIEYLTLTLEEIKEREKASNDRIALKRENDERMQKQRRIDDLRRRIEYNKANSAEAILELKELGCEYTTPNT